MILSFINMGRLKTLGFALGFQHFPLDLANVNEWKIMFDPSIVGFQKLATDKKKRTILLNLRSISS